MVICEERDNLLAQKEAAWRDYYDLQNIAGQEKACQSASQKVHHIMRALADHYRKHRCNESN